MPEQIEIFEVGRVSKEFRPGLEDDLGRLPRRFLGLDTQTVPF